MIGSIPESDQPTYLRKMFVITTAGAHTTLYLICNSQARTICVWKGDIFVRKVPGVGRPHGITSVRRC